MYNSAPGVATIIPYWSTVGQPITLSWESSGAASAVLSGVGTVPVSGSQAITPTVSDLGTITTSFGQTLAYIASAGPATIPQPILSGSFPAASYTLTVTGPGGNASATVVVFLMGAAPTPSIEPHPYQPGESGIGYADAPAVGPGGGDILGADCAGPSPISPFIGELYQGGFGPEWPYGSATLSFLFEDAVTAYPVNLVFPPYTPGTAYIAGSTVVHDFGGPGSTAGMPVLVAQTPGTAQTPRHPYGGLLANGFMADTSGGNTPINFIWLILSPILIGTYIAGFVKPALNVDPEVSKSGYTPDFSYFKQATGHETDYTPPATQGYFNFAQTAQFLASPADFDMWIRVGQTEAMWPCESFTWVCSGPEYFYSPYCQLCGFGAYSNCPSTVYGHGYDLTATAYAYFQAPFPLLYGGAAPTCSLLASPSAAAVGDTVNLIWETRGAQGVMLIRPDGTAAPVALNGSLQVVVEGDGIYQIVASGSTGNAICSVNVLTGSSSGCPACGNSVWECTPGLVAIDQSGMLGIPKIDREQFVNVVRFRLDVSKDTIEDVRTSKQFKGVWTYWQQASIDQFGQQYPIEVESQGLITPRGGMKQAATLADRIFRRHAFKTPRYTIKAQLSYLNMELGDYLEVSHPKLLDLVAGTLGVTNVICEIVERKPNYGSGYIEFTVLDTRFMNMTTAWHVAVNTETVWPGASGNTEMFISDNTGHYSDASVGRTLF